MKTYQVEVHVICTNVYEVEANSMREAQRLAQDLSYEDLKQGLINEIRQQTDVEEIKY